MQFEILSRENAIKYSKQSHDETSIIISINDFDDLNSHAQYRRALQEGYSEEEALDFVNRRSRDNTRSPMSWNDQRYAGFSDTKPWLANNEYYQEINVALQINDSDSVLSYSRLSRCSQSFPSRFPVRFLFFPYL